MNKLVIFGNGEMARIAEHYFRTDTDYQVAGFTVDGDYLEGDTFCDKPIVAFEEVETLFGPHDHEMFVAISYRKMNAVREAKFFEAKNRGFRLASYISSRCAYLSDEACGENCFILEQNTIQPFVAIDDNVWLWSGNHIGHSSHIKSHCYLASQIVVSGFCTIGCNTFIGVNATLREQLNIAPRTLIGAGAVVMADTAEADVVLAARSTTISKKSHELDF